MPDVVVIGAGRIGLPLAGRLVAAGHDVGVIDIRPDRRTAVTAAGATWLGTAATDWDQETSAAPTVLTVLPGSPELRTVMCGPSQRPGTGLLARLATGTTWIDMTSAAPDLAAELVSASAAAGVAYVDAAIGGGPDDARRGALMLYVGGTPADVTRVRPLLECVADRIHHLGPSGAGYLAKLLVNQLWFGQALALAEVLLLAGRAGLDPRHLATVLEEGPAASAFTRDYLPRMLDGDRLPAFGLDRIVEELESLRRAAAGHGTPWTVATAVADVHCAALGHFGEQDGELLGPAYLELLAEEPPASPLPPPRWRVRVDRRRPPWKRLGAQILAQVDVYAPDAALYHVKIIRNGPIAGSADLMDCGPDPAALARFLRRNLEVGGRTGWLIKVETPARQFRAARTRYVQPVAAQSLVIDVASAVVEAIRRGDQLWRGE